MNLIISRLLCTEWIFFNLQSITWTTHVTCPLSLARRRVYFGPVLFFAEIRDYWKSKLNQSTFSVVVWILKKIHFSYNFLWLIYQVKEYVDYHLSLGRAGLILDDISITLPQRNVKSLSLVAAKGTATTSQHWNCVRISVRKVSSFSYLLIIFLLFHWDDLDLHDRVLI